MDEKKIKALAETKLTTEYKTYVATKLATDPEFAQKHAGQDEQGNPTVSFTPEMFASVSIADVARCGCSCNFIKGFGDNCDEHSGDIHCSDQAGSTPK